MLGADGPESLRDRRIDRSFRCVGCGYDLQGLEAMGVCPECGMSIRRSIRETIDPTVHSLPEIKSPATVAKGLRLFAWGMSVSVLGLIAGGVLQHQPLEWNDVFPFQPDTWPRSVRNMIAVGNVLFLVGILAACTTIVGLVWMRPLAVSQRTTRSARMLVRLFIGCGLWTIGLLLLFDRLPGTSFEVLASKALNTRTKEVVLDTIMYRFLLELLPLVGGCIVLLGIRSFFGELGRRSREFRTATSKRQKVIDVLVAMGIWVVGALLQLIGAIERQSALVTLGTVVRFISGLLVVIGIVYLMMNLLWIARALASPPPRLTSLLTAAGRPGPSD